MKTICSKIILVICFQLLASYSFSQQNLFNPENDTAKSSGSFYDRVSNSNQNVDYLRHCLSVQLKTELISDTAYLSNFHNFLTSINAILTNPQIDRFGLVTVRLSDTANALDYMDIFYDSNLFEYIYPSAYGKIENNPTDPTDPEFQNQWYLKQPNSGTVNKDIDAKKTWVITKGIATANIYYFILDSGILPNNNGNITHNDLRQSNITNSQDFTGTGWNTTIMHGTNVTGVVGAAQNNAVAIAGLGPNVRIVMYKTWNTSQGFSIDPIVAAIREIVDFKRQSPNFSVVLSASFTTTGNFAPLRSVIQSCDSLNIIGVYPTGNDNDTMRYPAKYSGNYPSVISVGGTNNNDELYPLSNYARNGTMDLVLVAPAQNIVTTTGTGVNAFTTSSGTSYAAPLVAGTIALMYSVRPQMNKTQVRNILIRGCDKPAGMNSQNYTTRYGYGRLNSFKCFFMS